MHAHGHDAARIRIALLLTLAFFVVELVGGWWTNSLALLSDAVHMFTDVGALTLALVTLWVAAQPPSMRKTYGYTRAEILGALANGIALCVVVIWIVIEASGRLRESPVVHSAGMTVVAAVGLGINVICAFLLRPNRQHAGLGVRAAFMHVLADLLGSVAAIMAGVVMLMTGWYPIDALTAIGIAVLVLVGVWSVVREAVDILMEGVPGHVDIDRLRTDLESIAGTCRLHDLHVWTLTTGQYALSAHAVIDGSVDGETVLHEMRRLLMSRFHIDHVTIQLERSAPCEPDSVHV
jgi:cobalt-zinc-cadmium efflux system protein